MNGPYQLEHLRSFENVTTLQPPPHEDTQQLAHEVGKTIPPIVLQWISEYGFIGLSSDAKGGPFILFLGIGPLITSEEDIRLFNYPNNPSNPNNYLIFAHEYDGRDDLFYGVDDGECVWVIKRDFAQYYYQNKEDFSNPNWIQAPTSVEQLLKIKLKQYLGPPDEFEKYID